VEAVDRAGFLRRAGTVALVAPRARWSGSVVGGLPPVLAELQRHVTPGAVVGRTSSGYDAARLLYNTRFDTYKPLAVVLCANVTDVEQTIAWAKRHGIHITPRGGGHSYGGYSSVPGGVIVDVSRMKRVSVVAGGKAHVGAGAKLIDVYAGLGTHGLAIPAGSCATVGLGGQVLGGGIGFLSRKFGATCDNLAGLTLVTADGAARTCSPTQNADLYWASRGGGGGNFGIATEYVFRTHAISAVSTFSATFPWSRAAALVAAWQAWAPSAPDELFSVVNLSNASGGSPSLHVSGQLVGPASRLNTLLGPLVSAVPPDSLSVKDRPFLQAVQYWAGCGPISKCRLEPAGELTRGTFFAKSDYVRRPLPPAAVGVITSALERVPTRAALLLDAYGGALNRVPKAATAFVHRDLLCSLQYLVYWDTPSDSAGAIAWLRAFYAAMRPYVTGEAYVNYIDPDLAARPQAYYGSNLPRLKSIKRRYDPGNLFHFKQSIPLR
jgi:FAD/FMN-containing dehydrogenase